jgi:preprotein translocase, secE subunit
LAGETNQKTSSAATNEELQKVSLSQAIKETRSELKKVYWPTQEELKKYTIVTLVTVAFFSIAIYIIDSGLGFVISKLINR